VHFEDFSGKQFERLVFAYCSRAYRCRTLEWYGEVGADLGRDIWLVIEDGRHGIQACLQCANRRRLTFRKVTDDLKKMLAAPQGKPDRFILVSGRVVSAALRDKVRDLVNQGGIRECEVWAHAEFEEKLRTDCPEVLQRFLDGEEFPDEPSALKSFAGLAAQGFWPDIIAEWARQADLDHWDTWASNAFEGIPHMQAQDIYALEELCKWLLGRVWPSTHPELRAALDNFRAVALDLVHYVGSRGDCYPREDRFTIPNKARMLDRSDPPEFRRLRGEQDAQEDVVRDLVFELTRAANLVCDTVRSTCDPSFRRTQGVLIVYVEAPKRPEYGPDERTGRAYPGLRQFKPWYRRDGLHFTSGPHVWRPSVSGRMRW
jgi:hypothetical protein